MFTLLLLLLLLTSYGSTKRAYVYAATSKTEIKQTCDMLTVFFNSLSNLVIRKGL